MKKNKKNDIAYAISEYVPDLKMRRPQRIARLLDWAAKNYPRQFLGPNLVVKGINGYSHNPRIDSKEVESIRCCWTRVRTILQQDYRRDLRCNPIAGVRATVDSSDALEEIPKRARRFISARNSLINTNNLIDYSKVPNSPLKEYAQTQIGTVIKMITAPSFERLLALPAHKPEKNA